jgi:mRNA interferase HigB
MRIIKPTRLREYWTRYPQAKPSLEQWLMRTKAATWASMADLRQTFPSANPVRVPSGRTVVVLDIAGNQYRLLIAIHDTMRKVFVLRLLTHAEYSRETWKDEL